MTLIPVIRRLGMSTFPAVMCRDPLKAVKVMAVATVAIVWIMSTNRRVEVNYEEDTMFFPNSR